MRPLLAIIVPSACTRALAAINDTLWNIAAGVTAVFVAVVESLSLPEDTFLIGEATTALLLYSVIL